ncbi:hypothetical protein NLG97_g10375 [Lecanicillium saksenae]|uniref:Uncharacterized protein n=1 Tax=Lecanicillium saksenae TaxID=468837 RepID=A0ACC1QFC7_9HYPO|nr:hypothetical protein NLG97_g10375 [Lecanicillium saksenae]
MAQTATRKRGRVATNSADSEEPSTRRKSGTGKTSRSRKGRTSDKNLGGNQSLQTTIRAAKQGRKGASDALHKIRAKRHEISLIIEEECRRSKSQQQDDRRRGPRGLAHGRIRAALARPLAGCEAFEDARRALQKLQSLAAARYDAVGDRDAGLAEPRWMRWRQDVLDLNALNGKARSLARQVAEGHLAPAGWPELADPEAAAAAAEEDQELAQIALEILDDALPKGAATWGSAAAQLMDVYGSILKDTFK